MATVATLIDEARRRLAAVGVESPRLDAELLLAHVLGKARRWLWTYPDTPLSPKDAAAFFSLLERRLHREPLPYLLGEWEFYGRPFTVSPAVLVPRPETELLVEVVLAWATQHAAARIVDVGTGSGVIAITCALELTAARCYAVDLSVDALAMAQGNAERHGVAERITWLQGDLLQPVRAMGAPPVDAIVANLPYIAEEEMPSLMPEVRDYEPRIALAAGAGGLQLIRRLIEESPAVLRPGGLLAMELGCGQAEQVRAILQEGGWQEIRIIADYAGIPRHILASCPVK